MKVACLVMLLLFAGCASDGYMGDTPTISPAGPDGDIKVEMQGGNMICVTENNDTENRSCVPVVHESGEDG